MVWTSSEYPMDGFIQVPSRKNPQEKANFLSKLCFWWMRKLFAMDARKELTMDDIYRPLQSDESKRVTDKLEKAWKREEEKLKALKNTPDSKKKKVASGEPSLLRAICSVFWWDYWKVGMGILVINTLLRCAQPLLQKGIIDHFSTSGSKTVVDQETALYYAAGLVLNSIAIAWTQHHSVLYSLQVAMRVRVACSSLAYRKILRLSKSALNQTAPGQIVNILSNDVSRFDVLAPVLHYLWSMPIQIFFAGIVMYIIIGPSAFAGLAVLLLLIVPVQFILNVYSKRWRRAIAMLTDRRVQLMGELISGIQVVKMYAWESPFWKIASSARSSEMRGIRNTTYLRAFSYAVTTFCAKLSLFLTLVTYVLLGNTLTADIVFTIGSFFTILQTNSGYFFPQAVMQTGETSISIKRLQDFLLLEEVSASTVGRVRSSSETHVNPGYESSDEASGGNPSSTEQMPRIIEEPVFVEMRHVSANWKIGQLPPTLSDVSLKIYGGELCAIVGKVGCGKSSLLNILLKELPIGSGNVYLRQGFDPRVEDTLSEVGGYVADNPRPVISYSSQDAWLFSGTVRDNILFGEAYDLERYHEVTKVCALLRDISLWPQGDMTLVGERGIALSGGQKARINLARAVYKRADLYLLDDPLSAVDPRVARHLFQRCINGYLKGKTRLLVTHQFQFLENTDTIVLVDRGLVKAQGSFEDLSKSSTEFTSLLNVLEKSDEEKEKRAAEGRSEETQVGNLAFRPSSNIPRCDFIDSLSLSVDYTNDSSVSSLSGLGQPSEVSLKGTLSIRVWSRYFGAGGSFITIILMIVIVIVSQMALTGTEVWLSYWSNLEAVRSSLVDDELNVTPNEYNSLVNASIFSYFGLLDENGLLPSTSAIYVYTALVLATIVFNLGRMFMMFAVCMRASDNLHDSMFRSVIRTTMRFFNVNASGMILNRFSRDVGIMDEQLPRAFVESITIMFIITCAFLVVIAVNPWMTPPMIFVILMFYVITAYYLKTAYGIKRLEAVCKSPAFSQVNATLQGLATIRSSGPAVNQALREQFDIYQDVHSGAWYLNIAASAALSFWLDLCAVSFVACVCFTVVLADSNEMLGGTAGFLVSQVVQIIGMLQAGIKHCVDACTFVTSVERILQYVDIEPEGSADSDNPPPPNWPTKGRLSMRKVYLSYNDDDPPVLKGLNLTIEPGSKVGVVGRTGAGKSSLISAIFRLENEGLDGDIKIDGRDTRTLGLEELRSRISIIPQEPVLFSGTLRYNLDPFDCYDDAALYDALREVELNNLSLGQVISEGGTNFSVGERQLICLARVILKNNRILVLDEATANIDARTDALIQKTLKAKFARHTVITVAHRLITVIESDRIILMDKGEIVEFGCPYELLRENPNGPFAEMVRQAGPVEADRLMQLAEAACVRLPPQHSLDLVSSNSDQYAHPAVANY